MYLLINSGKNNDYGDDHDYDELDTGWNLVSTLCYGRSLLLKSLLKCCVFVSWQEVALPYGTNNWLNNALTVQSH